MKFGTLSSVIAATLIAVLAIPVQLAAQDQGQDKDKRLHHHKHHHYQLIDMGTFGGPDSSFDLLPDSSPEQQWGRGGGSRHFHSRSPELLELRLLSLLRIQVARWLRSEIGRATRLQQ